MDTTAAITAFATLFVVVDPIGTTPIFVALTQGMDAKRRRAIALRACGIAFGILLLFSLFGSAVLEGMGISLPAFRIAGGMLLFLIAIDMLFERRTQRREERVAEVEHDPSVFPIATPLIAGPGSMAAMILLTSSDDTGWQADVTAIAVMGAVLLLVLLLFNTAGLIERLLGRTGTLVVTRLMGMLLAALSVQLVLDGLASLGLLPTTG